MPYKYTPMSRLKRNTPTPTKKKKKTPQPTFRFKKEEEKNKNPITNLTRYTPNVKHSYPDSLIKIKFNPKT